MNKAQTKIMSGIAISLIIGATGFGLYSFGLFDSFLNNEEDPNLHENDSNDIDPDDPTDPNDLIDEELLINVSNITSSFLFVNISGDTGFDAYINGTAWDLPDEMNDYLFGCSSFYTSNGSDGNLFGRNFDWRNGLPLLVFSNSSKSYASISMVDADMLSANVSQDVIDYNDDLLKEFIRIPLDGMNEHGLVVSCMMVSTMESFDKPERRNLHTVEMMRLFLDYAKDLSEVKTLCTQFDSIFNPVGPPLHYLVADKYGNSMVMEWVGGEIRFIEMTEAWQVATNFQIYEKDMGEINSGRYFDINSTLATYGGNITASQAMDILQNAHQATTQWSTVYNQADLSIEIILHQDYGTTPVKFSIF